MLYCMPIYFEKKICFSVSFSKFFLAISDNFDNKREVEKFVFCEMLNPTFPFMHTHKKPIVYNRSHTRNYMYLDETQEKKL